MIEVEQEKISTNTAEEFPPELQERRWSVISFSESEASGLTYAEAEQKMKELETQKVSGLCIVTDEVAARISKSKAETRA